MITSQAFSLQQNLINVFEQNDELMEVLAGDGIYDTVPRNAAYPFITVGRVISTPVPADGDDMSHRVELLIYARDGGRQKVLELAGMVSRIATKEGLTTASIACVNAMVERLESGRSRNGLVWQASLTFRFVTALTE